MDHVRIARALTLVVAVAVLVLPLAGAASQRPPDQTPALKIVVIEGEGGVNIIQQKSAVAPVIEVRDRNDHPVAGAVVNFAIRGGRATFSGGRTFSAVTDVAGRAAASGLTPTGSGALQISASAAFQGQTAAVTIAQTNVMTAAEAAAAASSSAGGGAGGSAAAGGGAAGGGGGLSATTIAIVGGAVAGGAVVATQTLGEDGQAYTGTFAGDIPVTSSQPFCGFTIRINKGTLVMHITHIDGSSVTGTAEVDEDATTVYNPSCNIANHDDKFHAEIGSLSGNSSHLTFNHSQDNTFTVAGGTGVRTWILSFSGALNGTEITGKLTNTEQNRNVSGGPIANSGTTVFPVTLR